eukprot:252292_1
MACLTSRLLMVSTICILVLAKVSDARHHRHSHHHHRKSENPWEIGKTCKNAFNSLVDYYYYYKQPAMLFPIALTVTGLCALCYIVELVWGDDIRAKNAAGYKTLAFLVVILGAASVILWMFVAMDSAYGELSQWIVTAVLFVTFLITASVGLFTKILPVLFDQSETSETCAMCTSLCVTRTGPLDYEVEGRVLKKLNRFWLPVVIGVCSSIAWFGPCKAWGTIPFLWTLGMVVSLFLRYTTTVLHEAESERGWDKFCKFFMASSMFLCVSSKTESKIRTHVQLFMLPDRVAFANLSSENQG